MKHAKTLILILALFTFLGCEKSKSYSPAEIERGVPNESTRNINVRVSSRTPEPSSLSLEEQAKTEVKKALEATSLCKGDNSDSYFTYSRAIASSGYTEHKNPSFTIESTSPLTEADRLNEITWKGKVQYRFTSSRNNEDGGWSDWKPYESLAMYVIPAVRRNGGWQVEPGLFARMHVKGECGK